MGKNLDIFFIIFIALMLVLPLASSHHDFKNSAPITSLTSSDNENDNNSSVLKDGNSGSSNLELEKQEESQKKDKEDKEIEERLKKIREKEEFKKEIKTRDGKTIRIEKEVEIDKDGEIRIKIKREIQDSEGNEREVKIEIKEKDGKRRIKVLGEEKNFSVETRLEIEDDFEDNETDLRVILSNGRKSAIKIMPDKASEIAIQKLKSKNFTLQLVEVELRNQNREVIYKASANKSGRLFGIFKTRLNIETHINSETGEALEIKKPWWAILVSGEDGQDESLSETDLNNSSIE